PPLLARQLVAQAIGDQGVPELVDRHRHHEGEQREQRALNLPGRKSHPEKVVIARSRRRASPRATPACSRERTRRRAPPTAAGSPGRPPCGPSAPPSPAPARGGGWPRPAARSAAPPGPSIRRAPRGPAAAAAARDRAR